MATASSLLSEDRFLCSVCLDVFTEPVSTPCGHNFCRECIHKCWDTTDVCQCPLCNRTFPSRPELHINTIMSDLAAEFRKLAQVEASDPDSVTVNVPCDICPGLKDKAVKSCLTCLTSFCKDHLEPHQRVAVLKNHRLIDPVSHLDDRMCEAHKKAKELYCRTDRTCICVLCIKSSHHNHSVVPLEEEYEAMMATKDDVMGNLQRMIQTWSEKIAEIEESLDVSEKEAEKEKEATVQVFTDLIQHVQRRQTELVEVIEERSEATKKKGEALLKELRMEVAELESKSRKLKQLLLSEDHHRFLQRFPSLASPTSRDWTGAVVDSNMSLEAVRKEASKLKLKLEKITEKVPEVRMRRMREHAVDLTFDPDTAHRCLVISQDGKQVATMGKNQRVENNLKRFEMYAEVLTKEGFTSGKFYFEVQVKGKTKWAVGVVKESVDRKGNTDLSVLDGYWTIGLDEGMYIAYHESISEMKLKGTLQKVGVFVDYRKGTVSFYDVDSDSHVYSFYRCGFTEKLYPYVCPQDNSSGSNSAPVTITPVPHSSCFGSITEIKFIRTV